MIAAVLALAMVGASAELSSAAPVSQEPQRAPITATAELRQPAVLPDAASAVVAGAVETTATPAAEPAAAPPAAYEPGPALVKPAAVRRTGNRRAWLALSVAQHSAASFDAWTTRRAISMGGFRETNPLLRPFAGNSSMYFAVQAMPLGFDFVGRRMQKSDNRWVRRLWWVPQAVQTGIHLRAGIQNLRATRR